MSTCIGTRAFEKRPQDLARQASQTDWHIAAQDLAKGSVTAVQIAAAAGYTALTQEPALVEAHMGRYKQRDSSRIVSDLGQGPRNAAYSLARRLSNDVRGCMDCQGGEEGLAPPGLYFARLSSIT